MAVERDDYEGPEPCPKCGGRNLVFRSEHPGVFAEYPETTRGLEPPIKGEGERAPEVLCPDCGVLCRYSDLP